MMLHYGRPGKKAASRDAAPWQDKARSLDRTRNTWGWVVRQVYGAAHLGRVKPV